MIDERLRAFEGELATAYLDLKRQFATLAATDPAAAMDRHGLELVETRECLGWVGTLHDGAQARALVDYFETALLRGDWQPRSACPMSNALHQARFVARCKLIKRLRALLEE